MISNQVFIYLEKYNNTAEENINESLSTGIKYSI